MERPNGERDRRANRKRHEKKLAPVAESGAADAADREPVGRCDHHREFFSARCGTGGDAGRGARDGERHGRGGGRVRRRKNDRDGKWQEKKYVPAATCGEAGGGDPARVRHRDRRGARTGSLWKLEIGRTGASGTRSGGRRRRQAIRSACPARMRSIEPAADGDEDAAPEISGTGSGRRCRRSGRGPKRKRRWRCRCAAPCRQQASKRMRLPPPRTGNGKSAGRRAAAMARHGRRAGMEEGPRRGNDAALCLSTGVPVYPRRQPCPPGSR